MARWARDEIHPFRTVGHDSSPSPSVHLRAGGGAGCGCGCGVFGMSDADEDAISVRLIRDMPWGGSANQGEHVLFRLVFHDGTDEKFAFSHELGQIILGNLTQYCSIAYQERTKPASRALESSAPYRATPGSLRTGHSADGKMVTLQVGTTHGFPVAIAMSLEMARQTIESLQKEILLAEQPKDDQRN